LNEPTTKKRREKFVGGSAKPPSSEARINLDKMSYAELVDLRTQVDRAMANAQAAEKETLRQKLIEMAKQSGLSLDDVVGRGRKGKGSVAPKYRDRKNPANNRTGRGRMPRWMVEATEGKAKRDDFLI
jgi:DNA-binding protein H-NS